MNDSLVLYSRPGLRDGTTADNPWRAVPQRIYGARSAICLLIAAVKRANAVAGRGRLIPSPSVHAGDGRAELERGSIRRIGISNTNPRFNLVTEIQPRSRSSTGT